MTGSDLAFIVDKIGHLPAMLLIVVLHCSPPGIPLVHPHNQHEPFLNPQGLVLKSICQYMSIYVNICQYMSIYVNICQYISIYIYIYLNMYIYIYINIYIYISLNVISQFSIKSCFFSPIELIVVAFRTLI